MKLAIIEGIKANKKGIIKKALIVGAAIAGLTIIGKVLASKGDEEDDDYEFFEEAESTEEE